jgi:hypothetical protein
VNIEDFDQWRTEYDQMSYADQQDFYDRMEADHGTQAGYNERAHIRFLEYVSRKVDPIYVLELGGWKGELACRMLNQFPHMAIWCNLEICRAAAKKTVFQSGKYHVWVPPDFAWLVTLTPCNIVIASHFIEHIRTDHLAAIFSSLPRSTRYIALQAPIEEDTVNHDWSGYHGSHILEIGWKQVGNLLGGLGYGEMLPLRDKTGIGEFRVYQWMLA